MKWYPIHGAGFEHKTQRTPSAVMRIPADEEAYQSISRSVGRISEQQNIREKSPDNTGISAFAV
jgi:hypothetical protein